MVFIKTKPTIPTTNMRLSITLNIFCLTILSNFVLALPTTDRISVSECMCISLYKPVKCGETGIQFSNQCNAGCHGFKPEDCKEVGLFPTPEQKTMKPVVPTVKPITAEALPHETIDQVFVMDCTGSMGSYIDTAKTKILELASKVSEKYPKKNLRLGFIGYRDITDWSAKKLQHISIPFSTDYNSFKNTLETTVFASGGGDLPEDVFTGLQAASDLKWKGGVRMLTLLSDAPHNEKTGRKSYLDFKPVLQKFSDAARNSDAVFSFSFFKIGSGTGDLGEKLKAMMPEGINFVEHVMKVENLFRSTVFSGKVYGRPSYSVLKKSYPRYKMESKRMMSYDVATAVPEMVPHFIADEVLATESLSLDRPTELRKKVEEDAKGSYMDTVFDDIARAVDRHSKLSSGSE